MGSEMCIRDSLLPLWVNNALLCHHTPFCFYHVEIGDEPEVDLKIVLSIKNKRNERLRNVKVKFFGLREDYHQDIIKIDSNYEIKSFKDSNGNIIHEVELPIILPKREILINVNYKVKLKVYQEEDFEASKNDYYLRPMPLQQSDNEMIKEIGKKLKRSSTKETVREVIGWVRMRIKYDRVYDRLGAITTLRRGRGSCIEISDLVVSILRSQGIPARVIRGYLLDDYHSWVEIFTNKGWIPIEPLAGLVGAIGVPWISIHAEENPREKEVISKGYRGCIIRWKIIL